MKNYAFLKRVCSLIALMLAVMLMLTACGGEAETSSTPSTESKQQEETDGTPSNDETASVSSDTPIVSDTSTVAPTTSGSGTASNSQGGTSWGKAPAGEVHVLMWRQYTKTEKALVDSYSKKTGVKIRTTLTTETEYPTKLVSLVSGGDSPDVICFSTRLFPGLAVKSAQPLNEKTFRLNDDCWYKTYMEPYKINGKYFGVAMNKAWNCEDCAYVTYYNPAVLRQCGVSAGAMPYDLYKQGKWNWDKQAEMANQVVKFGKGNYSGLSVQSTDLFMHTAGADFVSYNGKEYKNNLGSVGGGSALTKAWKEVAELNANKLLTSWDLTNVQQGKVGLFSAIAYGLYNEGTWFDNVTGGYQSLQAVPMAGPAGSTAYIPVRPKVWGVAKRAKNAEGAAYFLRYFLDVKNFNLSSTFYNAQFEKVYEIITSKTAKKSVIVGLGVVDYVKTNTYANLCGRLSRSSATNITTVLNSEKGEVNNGVNRANKDIAKMSMLK